MIGTVDAQMATAEYAIFTSTINHPERHGALMVDHRTAREVHVGELAEIEGDWIAHTPVRRLLQAGRLAATAGDTETAARYAAAIRRRWHR